MGGGFGFGPGPQLGPPTITSRQLTNKECSGPVTRTPSVVIAPYQNHRTTVLPKGNVVGIVTDVSANAPSRQCATVGAHCRSLDEFRQVPGAIKLAPSSS